MIIVNLEKELIVNAWDTSDKVLSHYAREAIMATCAKAAGILK